MQLMCCGRFAEPVARHHSCGCVGAAGGVLRTRVVPRQCGEYKRRARAGARSGRRRGHRPARGRYRRGVVECGLVRLLSVGRASSLRSRLISGWSWPVRCRCRSVSDSGSMRSKMSSIMPVRTSAATPVLSIRAPAHQTRTHHSVKVLGKGGYRQGAHVRYRGQRVVTLADPAQFVIQTALFSTMAMAEAEADGNRTRQTR